MDKKSKQILGLVKKQTVRVNKCFYTDAEKHEIIQDYLTSGRTKRDIWEKYTGQLEEHGQLLRWMRKLGYPEADPVKRVTFVKHIDQMKNKQNQSTEEPSESFEKLQLKKRIEELEQQLKDAEMKSVAYSTMIDIAEKEFKIPIRKKYDTKPSKK
jgi:transposase